MIIVSVRVIILYTTGLYSFFGPPERRREEGEVTSREVEGEVRNTELRRSPTFWGSVVKPPSILT